jgi:type I restriction enzyme S subunit
MTPETFFKKFELFADAPDAVAKMRDFVLGLAITGKLATKDESEGTATELLNKAISKQKRVKRTNETGNSAVLPDYPEHWVKTELGVVTSIIRGVTFPASAKSKTKHEGDVACLRTASVQTEIDWDDLIFISPKHVKRADQWVKINDIIISMANSYALVGKVAVVRNIPEKASFGGFLAAIRPNQVEPYFLLYVLRSPWMQKAFRATSSQTTNIANISLGGMRPLPFPLPPLAEQKRTVAKVDELMALCDELEARQNERDRQGRALQRAALHQFHQAPTPSNLNLIFNSSFNIHPSSLRQSILTLAVQGKLVPQDPKDEPANESLKNAVTYKRSLVEKSIAQKPKKLSALTQHESENRLPSLWKWTHLQNLTQLITKGSSPKWQGVNYVDSKEKGILFITSENVGSFRLRKLSQPKYVESKFNEIEPRSILQKGDILINLVGASIGRSALWDLDDVANINQAVGIVRFLPDLEIIEHRYLLFYLNSPSGQKFMFENQVDMARANISLKNLSEFPIPLPPTAEQKRIVAKVDQLMALVDQLETQLTESNQKATQLLDAVVAELTERK